MGVPFPELRNWAPPSGCPRVLFARNWQRERMSLPVRLRSYADCPSGRCAISRGHNRSGSFLRTDYEVRLSEMVFNQDHSRRAIVDQIPTPTVYLPCAMWGSLANFRDLPPYRNLPSFQARYSRVPA